MIGIRVFSILIFVNSVVALNSDGFCSFVETYTDRITSIKTFKVKIPVSKKCGIFSTRVCFEYQEQTKYERVAEDIQKTRTKSKCCQGYIQVNRKCIPVCSLPCFNGRCTEPEICTCSVGYHKNEKEICVKNECDPSMTKSDQCVHGTCTPNGICECNEGFIKSDSNVNSSVGSECLPECSEGCLNVKCVSPEKCICNSGYVALNSSVCIPICQNGCIFGTCVEPNKCSCMEGFKLRNESDYICDPICSGGCVNGKCEEPDLCLCDVGFEFSEESKVCEPVCDDGCVNSNCTSPNICTCDMGFQPLNETHCDIICENCTHGYCDEPNYCQCDEGYYMNIEENVCVRNECTSNLMEEMKDICENGYCSDGICMCDAGYEKNTKNVCAPTCSLECVNGYCVEPEVCQCNVGHDFSVTNFTDDGNCTNCTSFTQWNVCYEVCEDCQDGTCYEGFCNCSDGYARHPQNRGKCILAKELVDFEEGMQSDYNAVAITMSLLGIAVIVILVGGVAYWRYVIYSRKNNACTADVVYQKEKDSILL